MKTLIIGGSLSGKAAKELADLLQYRARIVNDGEVTDYAPVFDGVEKVVVSPGVKPWSPLLRYAVSHNYPVISEMEFGFRHFRGRVVGITGTNGKTTTTELTTALLNVVGVGAMACGNIGLPLSALAAARRRGEYPELTTAVAEVSSFQLEYVDSFAPCAALCLNLASDHVDRYKGGFAEYCAVKRRIFGKVPAENCCYGLSFADRPRRVSAPDGDRVLLDGREVVRFHETQLSGRHNLENLCGALELLARLVPNEKLFTPEFRAAIAAFRVGHHRLELVCERDGVRFIDDSKATNPASVVAALESTGSSPVRLILGGLDKAMDFSEMLPAMRGRVAGIYLIGETEEKLYGLLASDYPCRKFGRDFEACVKAASAEAKPGETVLLSPACASMDMFRDYKERGDIFARCARSDC